MGATPIRFLPAARMLAVLVLACSGSVSAEGGSGEDSALHAQPAEPAPPPDSIPGTAPAPAPAPTSSTLIPASAPDTVPAAQAEPDSAAKAQADSTAKAASADSATPGGESLAGEEEPEGITIEVDAKRSLNEGKSLPLALLFSATLPGAGELYLEDKGKAKTFLLMEAGFWAGLYVAWLSRESYLQSARNHASEYAGIDAGSKSEEFLETMAVFRAYQEKQHRQDSYELAQVLSNKREQDYDIKPVEENYWDFGSSANPENTRNWRSFQSTLRYYRASKVAMSFALGALALNRLGSLVNTLQTYKRTSAKRVGWELTPDLGPDYAGTRFTLRF